MTQYKWQRIGNTWQVFSNEKDEETGEFPIIWSLTQDGNTNSDKQQAKKEMKVFLKSIQKKAKANPDEDGTETDD